MRLFLLTAALICLSQCSGSTLIGHADDLENLPEAKALEPKPTAEEPPAAPKPIDQLIPLNAQKSVLIDKAEGKVILQGEVVLRAGLLEMLVCLKQTKEHESILSIDSEARVVHAGLLAVGAKVGKPVQFLPEFQAPTGQQIDIWVMWQNTEGRWHRENAQRWIRHATRKYFIAELQTLPEGLKIPESSDLRYDPKHHELLWFGVMTEKQRDELLTWSKDEPYRAAVKKLFTVSQIKAMSADWVFAGSGFVTDEETGKEFYRAESGDLICVANFSSALLDVREKSSDSGEEGLAYEAWEERIPPLGTKVRIELIPVKEAAAEKPAADATEKPKTPPAKPE